MNINVNVDIWPGWIQFQFWSVMRLEADEFLLRFIIDLLLIWFDVFSCSPWLFLTMLMDFDFKTNLIAIEERMGDLGLKFWRHLAAVGVRFECCINQVWSSRLDWIGMVDWIKMEMEIESIRSRKLGTFESDWIRFLSLLNRLLKIKQSLMESALDPIWIALSDPVHIVLKMRELRRAAAPPPPPPLLPR